MKESYTKTNEALIVHLKGELDQHSAVRLRGELDKKIFEGTNHLIFDLKELEFMDSSGIGVILGRYKNLIALGGSASLVSPKPTVEKLLHLAALDRIIPIFSSLEDAILKVRGEHIG